MERRTINRSLNAAAVIATIAAVPLWFGDNLVNFWIATALALTLIAARVLPTSELKLPFNLTASLLTVLMSIAFFPYFVDLATEEDPAQNQALEIAQKANKTLSTELREKSTELKSVTMEFAKLKPQLEGEQAKSASQAKELQKLKQILTLNSAPELVPVSSDEEIAIEVAEFIGDGLIEAWIDEEKNKILSTSITGRVSGVWQPSADTTKNLKDRGRNQFEHTLPYIKKEVDSAVAKLASSGWAAASIEPISFSRDFSAGKHTLHFRVTPKSKDVPWQAKINITKSRNNTKHVVTVVSLPESKTGSGAGSFPFFVPAKLDGK